MLKVQNNKTRSIWTQDQLMYELHEFKRIKYKEKNVFHFMVTHILTTVIVILNIANKCLENYFYNVRIKISTLFYFKLQ